MPHDKGRKSRTSDRDDPRSTQNSRGGWAAEADHTEESNLLYRMMLQQMTQGLAPGRLELPSLKTESSVVLPQSWPPSSALVPATEETDLKSTRVRSPTSLLPEPQQTFDAAATAVEEAGETEGEAGERISEDVAAKSETDEAGSEAGVADLVVDETECKAEERASDTEEIGCRAEEAEKDDLLGFLQLNLQRLRQRNNELQETTQRQNIARVERWLDELAALEELHAEHLELLRFAADELRPEIEVQLQQLNEYREGICDNLRVALRHPWLRRRFGEHRCFVELGYGRELLKGYEAGEPKAEEGAMSEEQVAPDGILDWLRKPRPYVEMSPGLTLRSTATPKDDEEFSIREVPNAPRLTVSSENSMDWRDLLYDTARAPMGRDGQSDLIFKAIGGGNEIDGACYMLELRRYSKWIMIDAGLRLRDPEARFPDLHNVPRPDLILITHAHLDHCGALPYLAQKWPNVPIWCHNLALPLIEHSLQLLQRQPLADPLFVAPEISLYSANEVDAVSLIGKEYNESYQLFNSDLSLTLWPSGHSVGACSISITGPQDSFFFTGEYAAHDEPSVAAVSWPEQAFDVVVASCNGAANKVYNRPSLQSVLIDAVEEILVEEGWAVFPVAEIGRAQDIYQIFAKAMSQGRLKQVPIYWDGAQRRLAMLYNMNLAKATHSESFDYLDAPGCLLDDQARATLQSGPGILLANPGFLQDVAGGALLARTLKTPRSAIFLPTKPDTPLDLKPLLRSITGNYQVYNYAWPANPGEDEMIEQLKRLSPQAVLLVHGTHETQSALCAELPAGFIRRPMNNGSTLSVRPRGE